MIADEIKIKYIGGPTALFEAGGLKFLTDPTFDPKGTDYPTNIYTLHKLADPAVNTNELGKVDFVLLTHDHHFDNLDNSGRKFLPEAEKADQNCTVCFPPGSCYELPRSNNHPAKPGTPHHW